MIIALNSRYAEKYTFFAPIRQIFCKTLRSDLINSENKKSDEKNGLLIQKIQIFSYFVMTAMISMKSKVRLCVHTLNVNYNKA